MLLGNYTAKNANLKMNIFFNITGEHFTGEGSGVNCNYSS